MNLVINSKKLGHKVTFSVPGGRYIYVDLNGCEGRLGYQICSGGELIGCTLSCDGSKKDFDRVCRSWYRAYMRAKFKSGQIG